MASFLVKGQKKSIWIKSKVFSYSFKSRAWKAWTHFPLVCRVLELPSVLGESRYLGDLIEKVKDRANELTQHIRHNDLQLQKLNEEKQEALEQLFVHISVVGPVLTDLCVCVCHFFRVLT